MKNLFDINDATEFVNRINKLTPASKAQWGKMNVSQMLKHSQTPLEIAAGSLKPKINPVIKFLFSKGAKKQMVSDQDFKKSLPTFREGIISDDRNFEKEKEKLIGLIRNFQQKGEAGVVKDPHPFFGPLSIQEWNILQTKHLDHHLRQFGV